MIIVMACLCSLASVLHAQDKSESGGNGLKMPPIEEKINSAEKRFDEKVANAEEGSAAADNSTGEEPSTKLGPDIDAEREKAKQDQRERELNRENAANQNLAGGEDSPDFTDGALKFLLYTLLFLVAIVVTVLLIKRSPRLRRFLGGGPIKVISRVFLGPKYAVHLVKIGNRVLVVGQGPDGLRTLSEIDDPAEITKILAEASEDAPESMTNTFREAMRSATGASEAPIKDKRVTANPPAAKPAAKQVPAPKAAAFDATVSDNASDSSEGSIDVDPGYSSQLKLAALRAKLDKEKASS